MGKACLLLRARSRRTGGVGMAGEASTGWLSMAGEYRMAEAIWASLLLGTGSQAQHASKLQNVAECLR